MILQAWQSLEPFITAIGAFGLSAGVITGFAYWVFKTFSEKWLDNKLKKDLEAYKHENQRELQRELQRLRLEIDALLDRTVRLHGKEFDALPEAWSLLNDAFSPTITTSLAILEYADLDRMDEVQLEEFLEKEELPEFKKREIKSADDKNKIYGDALHRKQFGKAEKLRRDFHDYVLKNGIFFLDQIRAEFLEINQMMIEALVERRMALDRPEIGSKFEKAQKLHGKGRALMEKLQGEIHARLWNFQSEIGKEGS